MPLMLFGEYRPDVSDYEGQTSRNILNVVPRGDGYGPVKALTSLSSALASACRGGFVAQMADGSAKIFAASSTRIYTMSNTDYTWTDVSKGGLAYSALSSDANWQFQQFGNYVIAVQANIVPQVFDLTSSSEFADLGGSPPQAAYIDVVNQFVVLSGLASFPYRIQWSGLNAVTTWDGTNQSDYQDFGDGGYVRGVAGGESGVVFQDNAIRRMIFAGPPLVFQIDRISQDNGIDAPYSIIRAGDRVFFHSPKGFHVLSQGGYPQPIGRERVDRTFMADLDVGSKRLFIGASDPRSSRVYWVFKSTNGVTDQFDAMLCYDYTLDKWTRTNISGEYLLPLSQPGITLETLGTIYASLESVPGSLDDYSSVQSPELAAFGTDHKFSFFRGSNLEATLESAELGTDGKRIFVRGFRPVTDAATVYGSASYRETLTGTATAGSEIVRNTRTGRCDLRRSARYSRLKARIPPSESWTYIAGIEPDMVPEGTQ